MNDEQKSLSSELPYKGNLQEAILHQDRSAVKLLMSLRSTESEAKSGSKMFKPTAVAHDALYDALRALGFSSSQLSEFFSEYGGVIPLGMKRLLECERPESTPKKSRLTSNSGNDDRVTPTMIRNLDYDSTWVLLQVCADYPNTSQLRLYEILINMNNLLRINIMNKVGYDYVRKALLNGFITEVECILQALDELNSEPTDMKNNIFNPDHAMSTSSTPNKSQEDKIFSPNSRKKSTGLGEGTLKSPTHSNKANKLGQENLLYSFLCPITREILIEPVTLQVNIRALAHVSSMYIMGALVLLLLQVHVFLSLWGLSLCLTLMISSIIIFIKFLINKYEILDQ